MELTGLFPIIRRWLVVILAATAMATLVGWVIGSSSAKTYEARAQMLVGPLNTDSNTMRASGDLAQTYAQLATTANVLNTVSRDVGVPRSELTTGVRATANSTTRFLAIRARSHDRKTAAEVANSVTLQLIALSKQDASRPEGQLRVIDAASTPKTPVSPRLDLIIPLAAVAGLLGSLTLILLFEFVGDTAESTEKVVSATGLTTLAIKRRRARPALPTEARRSDSSRIIATQAELSASEVRCILLTGVSRNDGTGALVLELSDLWGERRRHVTVLDAGSGEITSLTGSVGRDGLTELLAAQDEGVETSRRSDSVDILGAGRGRGAEAIELEEAHRVVSALTGDGSLLVVHGDPATLSAATLVWAQVADVTILVARRFQARRSAIEEAATNLQIVGAHVGFAVLHDAPRQGFTRPGGDRRAAAPTEEPPTIAKPIGPTPRPPAKRSMGPGPSDPKLTATPAGRGR